MGSRWLKTVCRRYCRDGFPRRSRRRRSFQWPRGFVPRDWADLFVTDGPVPSGEDSQAKEGTERRRGLLRRLRENLSKTRQALGSEIQATLLATLDEHTWERLEEALIMADVGAATTAAVVAELEREAGERSLSGPELSERLIELLAQSASGDEGRIDIRA